MYNIRKNKIVSKRHCRRIIANNTDIDIAGFSEHISNTVNIFSKDSFNLNLHGDTPAEVHTSNLHDTKKVFTKAIFLRDNYNNFQHNNNVIETNNCNDYNSNTNEAYEATNNINDENELRNALATWAVSHNITRNACNDLLCILNQYTSHNISKDIRTLLQTPRRTDVSRICEGEYFHLGLHDIIKKMLSKNNDTCINLIMNIDGLPLAKSSQATLWTILCSNTVNKAVYFVGAYFGY